MTSKNDLTMDLFSKKEDKAVNEIEKVNAGMTLIRETIRNTGDEIVESNSLRVAQILNDCISHFQKYKSYLNGMNGMQQSLLWKKRRCVEWRTRKSISLGAILSKCCSCT